MTPKSNVRSNENQNLNWCIVYKGIYDILSSHQLSKSVQNDHLSYSQNNIDFFQLKALIKCIMTATEIVNYLFNLKNNCYFFQLNTLIKFILAITDIVYSISHKVKRNYFPQKRTFSNSKAVTKQDSEGNWARRNFHV